MQFMFFRLGELRRPPLASRDLERVASLTRLYTPCNGKAAPYLGKWTGLQEIDVGRSKPILSRVRRLNFHVDILTQSGLQSSVMTRPVKAVSEYFSKIGKKGGRAKTERKSAAVLANLAKAREKRWPQSKNIS